MSLRPIKYMQFEWGPIKGECNYAKHKISFEFAAKVFDDPLIRYEFDDCEDEERWLAIGKALGQYLLLGVHTYRSRGGEEYVRIISARKATRHEIKRYEDKWGS